MADVFFSHAGHQTWKFLPGHLRQGTLLTEFKPFFENVLIPADRIQLIRGNLFNRLYYCSFTFTYSGKHVAAGSIMFLCPLSEARTISLYVTIAGLLLGSNIGIAIVDICYIVFIARLNWQKEANDVSLFLLVFH